MTVEQEIINYLLGSFCAIGGYFVKTVMNSIKELQNNESKIKEKVSDIEILVAGTYMRRDEFEKLAGIIFTKLDKISDKLDMKADKK